MSFGKGLANCSTMLFRFEMDLTDAESELLKAECSKLTYDEWAAWLHEHTTEIDRYFLSPKKERAAMRAAMEQRDRLFIVLAAAQLVQKAKAILTAMTAYDLRPDAEPAELILNAGHAYRMFFLERDTHGWPFGFYHPYAPDPDHVRIMRACKKPDT